MSEEKQKQIQEYQSKQLIDELSKMPPMVIATAYLHAINYTVYGEDVTERWETAKQNASALEKAYRKGYHDALQIQAESDIETLIIEEADKRDLTYAKDFNGRAYALMDVDWIGYFDTIDAVAEYLGISEEIDESRK